jgi:hypothetical protein
MIEAHAQIAHVCAGMGNVGVARAHADVATTLSEHEPVQHFSEFAWLLSAAYAMMDDAVKAQRLAERAARAFVDEALRMDADLAEAYARLPWHRETMDFLNGRSAGRR